MSRQPYKVRINSNEKVDFSEIPSFLANAIELSAIEDFIQECQQAYEKPTKSFFQDSYIIMSVVIAIFFGLPFLGTLILSVSLKDRLFQIVGLVVTIAGISGTVVVAITLFLCGLYRYSKRDIFSVKDRVSSFKEEFANAGVKVSVQVDSGFGPDNNMVYLVFESLDATLISRHQQHDDDDATHMDITTENIIDEENDVQPMLD